MSRNWWGQAIVLGAAVGSSVVPIAAPAQAPEQKPAAEFKAASPISRLTVSPDGKQLALGHQDGLLTLLEGITLQLRTKLVTKQGPSADCMAFSPDGATLATGSFDGAISLWKSPGAAPRRINTVFPASAVTFTPEGRNVRAYLPSATITNWEAATGTEQGTVRLRGPGSDASPRTAVFSRNGKSLAISGVVDTDHTVRVWDSTTGRLKRHFKEYPKLVDRLALTPDGGRLATVSEDGMLRVWEVATGKPVSAWKVGGFPTAVALSDDGTRVAASTDSDPAVQVWDLAAGRVTAKLPGHPDGARDLAFAPDGKLLYSAALDVVRVWKLAR